MDLDTKLKYLLYGELILSAALLIAAIYLDGSITKVYRLWEVFPAFLAASITTFGLKSMKEKT